MPRQIRNVAWTFEAKRFALYPEVSCFDTVKNLNDQQWPAMTHRCVDSNGNHIMASQRLLQNERRRTMMTFFGKLLPRILSKAALLAIATVLSDRNRELVHARTIGVLHALCVWRPCLYHNITQGFEIPRTSAKHIAVPKDQLCACVCVCVFPHEITIY